MVEEKCSGLVAGQEDLERVNDDMKLFGLQLE